MVLVDIIILGEIALIKIEIYFKFLCFEFEFHFMDAIFGDEVNLLVCFWFVFIV